MNDMEIRVTLAKVIKEIEVLNAKVSMLPQVQIHVSSRLLPTLVALQKIGFGTATQVSAVTCRCRAFESKNLNDLFMLGVVSKERHGHERIFTPKPDSE
jgi:hypothetical protein